MHKHLSSGANRSSDVAVTVNINAEFDLMAVNPIIECLSRDLVSEYCNSLESSAVYTVPPWLIESLPGRSNRSLPLLRLNMQADEIIPTFPLSKIYIRLCLPNALTLTRLQSYEMLKVLLIVRINISGGIKAILKFPLHRDEFPYRRAWEIPLTQGVPYPLQCKVRTPPPHFHLTILVF